MISIVAWFASLFALGVIALGAFTRLIDAGLGCPDWPGCYGHLTVSAAEQAGVTMVAYKAWAEMIHRYFAGTLSLLVLMIVSLISVNFFTTKTKTSAIKANIIAAIFLIALVAYQIILGQWTVTLKLLPVIVTQHLLGGFLILSTCWSIYLINTPRKTIDTVPSQYYFYATLLGVVLLFCQILLGAWTSTNYASLSCLDFPFCNQTQWMPTSFKEAFNLFSPLGLNYEGGVLSQVAKQTIQMTHRLGALVVATYLFILSGLLILKLKTAPDCLRLVYSMLGLLCLQICFGVSNVIFKLPVAIAIAHNLTAVLLLLTLITMTFLLVKKKS